MARLPDPQPPRPWAIAARLFIRGEKARFILSDLDESFARDLERGMSPSRAARRYAWNVVGSVWTTGTETLTGLTTGGVLLDAKLGVRMLAKQPMLTGVAMLALGLGIPASLSVHHLASNLYSSLPVPEGERVLGVRHWDPQRGNRGVSSVHEYERWRESLTAFSALGATRSYSVNVHAGDPGQPPVRGAEMTASAFDILRVAPLLGRYLDSTDEARDAPNVVVLGEDLWASRYAGDPDIVGKTLHVGRRQHTVVGVMPASFRFPEADQVWLPMRAQAVDYELDKGPDLYVFGRLADRVQLDQANLEVQIVTERMAADEPERYAHSTGEVVEMSLLILGQSQFSKNDPEVLLLESMMLILLLIVCGNVGLLVLARTATRSGEMAVRAALGASRRRIVSQIFIEALILATVATGAGLMLAEVVARWIMRVAALYGFLPYWVDLTLTPGSVLTALGLASLCAVVAGVIPAYRVTGSDVQAHLQRTAASNSTIRLGFGAGALIVAEVAISVGFLAMGGVLARSFFQETEGKLGYEPAHYVTSRLSLPWMDPLDFPELGSEEDFAKRVGILHREILTTLAEDRDVRGVGLGGNIPGTYGTSRRIILEFDPRPGDPDLRRTASVVRVDVAFFKGLDRPILTGRDFVSTDAEGPLGAHRSAVIVNTSFVERVLDGRNPIGQRFRYPQYPEVPAEEFKWFEIVGVVGPFGVNPTNPTRDEGVYRVLGPGELNPATVLVETAIDPIDFIPRLRRIVGSVDPEATIQSPMPLVDLMDVESQLIRWASLGQLALASIAFLLSVTGLYALMSFTVARRTREIGIRAALGARAVRIVATIAQRAAIQLGIGLVLGSVWAWVLLKEVSGDSIVLPINIPITIGVTVAGTALIGIVACAAPTLRGIRIPPTEALRDC